MSSTSLAIQAKKPEDVSIEDNAFYSDLFLKHLAQSFAEASSGDVYLVVGRMTRFRTTAIGVPTRLRVVNRPARAVHPFWIKLLLTYFRCQDRNGLPSPVTRTWSRFFVSTKAPATSHI